jgi:hypothetical protein
MNVLGVISNAATYSARILVELDKLIVLALLAIIPVLDIVLLGYLARVIRSTPLSSHPPPITGWGEMFVDGLKILVISLCYLLGGAVVSIALYLVGSAPLALAGLPIVFLGYLLLPMAVVHSIATEDISKGLAIGEVVRKVGTIGWFDYLVLVGAVFLLPLALMISFLIVPVVGLILAVLAFAPMGVFIARASAVAYY